ncbi:MAG: porin family protein [candidate division KSB1 bacterium]|nr:porin family protein [candidate division KSB1 bacterium]MDZ7366304.1 porin family protein [candidate division KSB1 bacterium]MDZ7403960.1 porin family protein [candidate division KSB1 bacterium]
MKNGKKFLTMATLIAIGMGAAGPAKADDKNSNIGLKLNLGLGVQDVPQAQNLEKGDAAALSLGYGVSQRVTLWLGVDLSKHQHEQIADLESHLAGLEFGLQYKFMPHERFRPYGKFGVGAFALITEATDTVLSGAGFTWGLGAEYRLARFLSVGAEVFWKNFDYTRRRIGEDNDFEKLPDPIAGNARGILINFTLH